jgi:hypothetical protein
MIAETMSFDSLTEAVAVIAVATEQWTVQQYVFISEFFFKR